MSFVNVIFGSKVSMEEAEESAKSLNKAMKGIGTDEPRMIKEITKNTNGQRQLIKQKYIAMYGKKLEDEIKSEISGNFLKGVLALLEPTDEYEARCLQNALHGIGTNEKVIIQMLCPKEAHEIEILRAAYQRLFNKDLDKNLRSDQGGSLGKIFRSIASAGREDISVGINKNLAKTEAQELYDEGKGKMGTNESVFIRILCSRSFKQLNETFLVYEQTQGHSIEKSIRDEMSGDLEEACLTIVKAVKNKPLYFAEKIHESMKGMGTKDDDLIRLLICRAEYDLAEIKQQYKLLYKKSLYEAIKSELSGDYKKLFLELVGKD